MLKTLYRRFFPGPSVASITAGFTKQIDQLRTLEADCVEQEVALAEQIDIAEANLIVTAKERRQAAQVAAKLHAFLND